MSTPFPTGASLGLQSTQVSNPISDAVHCGCGEASPEMAFRDIFAGENLLSDILAKLKKLLPEEQFIQLEELVYSGNGLPFAAIFSPESPLFDKNMLDIPQTIQDAIKPDGSLFSPLAVSTLKLNEDLTKHGSDATGRALNSLRGQIGEALSIISSNGESAGKQLQDLLVTVKTEFAVSDIVPKMPSTPSVGGEGTATPAANINSAISGLAQLQNFQASGGSPLPPAIAAPLGEEGWGQAMGERIMWMIGKGVQTASIRINPPNLGPVQINVSVQNDQTSVNMLAQHGVVKEALEAAIPRLREMLHESNLQLVNVDVSHRENMDQGSRSALFHQGHSEHADYALQQEQELATPVEEEIPRYYISSGLLDDYA